MEIPAIYMFISGIYSSLDIALKLSAIGIYLHAISIALVIGGGLAALVLEFIGNYTSDQDYIYIAEKTIKAVAVAFTYGAISGTIVEFGLVQIWNGIILAISSWVLIPLYLELIAFLLEGSFIFAVLYTWDKIRNPWIHWIITLVFVIGAVLSGAFITSVNSWMQVPWGVGDLIKMIYPWAPVYGPSVSNVDFLFALKEALIKLSISNKPGSIILTPSILNRLIEEYGELVNDPWIALKNPYAYTSILHQLLAASIVGVSWIGAGLAIVGLKNRNRKDYFKVFKAVAILGAILLIIQGIEGHEMGMAVLNYQPTKFAMIAGLVKSGPDPVVGLTAYGDPNHVFTGFDKLLDVAKNHPNGDIQIAGLKLRDIAVRDTLAAEELLPVVHLMYMIKIGTAAIGIIIALCFLSTLLFKRIWENRKYILYELGILFGILMPLIAGLGWAVREIGRKPWSVYGLLYPQDIMTSIEVNTFIATFIIGSIVIAFLIMAYVIYIVLTREVKIPRILTF